MRTLEEVSMTLVERAGEWSAQLVQKGIEQGLERGLAHERRLLRRLAERKFDAATAARLMVTLEGLSDPERLAQVGEWVIECRTGAELLARAADPPRTSPEGSPR